MNLNKLTIKQLEDKIGGVPVSLEFNIGKQLKIKGNEQNEFT